MELAGRPYLMIYNNLFKKMQQILIEMKGFFSDEYNTFWINSITSLLV